MSQKKELWQYNENERVWVGKYQNSQNISHWHDECEVVYVCKGKLDILIDKTKYSLKENDSFFIESKKIHSMNAINKNTIVMIFIFSYDLVKNIMDQYELLSPILTHNYNLPDKYNILLDELVNKHNLFQIKTQTIIQDFIIEVIRNEKVINKKKTKKMDEKLLLLLNDMDEKYQYYTMNDAANFMGMNTSYFSRFFHNNIGISFSKYLNCIKVENAVNLINSNHNFQMTEIAITCGFQTIRNFNRIMKIYTGYTPSTIPSNYVFNGLIIRENGEFSNPTLSDCKLIEYSSPHS